MSPDDIETISDRAPLIPERTRTLSTHVPPGTAVEDDLGLTGCAGSCCCHPKSFCHRLTALILMCLLGFGSYFCFDNPGALQREVKDAMDISTYQFANLYAWYSWPNVILPVIGGYLMDSVLGIRLGTNIFAVFIILGQILFALGAFLLNYPLMQVGRFVFGIGGESLAVAQNTYAVSWFKGKELNMVFGFQLSIARLGSSVNFWVMGDIYAYFAQFFNDYTALGWTLLLAGSTCIMSFVCSLILGCMDKRAERLLHKTKTETGEVVRASDVLTFPPTFWLLSIVCLAYYVAIFPFISLGQVFFIKKYGFEAKSANFITGLIYLISAPASPVLGFLIDKTARNVSYVFISIVATLIGHAFLAFTMVNPYWPVVFMGVAYSLLASALWPIAALIIPEYQLGTAYGLMQAIQNMGLALITMLSGVIVDKMGYLWLETFFIFWLVIALIATILIWLIDFSGTGYLNMSVPQRDAYDEKLRQKAEQDARNAARRKAVMRPRTANELRNRYLCRIGAVLPPHLGHAGLVMGYPGDIIATSPPTTA
ncbi:hypothetical protein TCAL_07172 [Tigriopus californicus]|uniref:Lysosomal dipeptide transporter MFSD1 n=1 Tax=Tigriopus californicus TaxID=6832 RepID=A0A553PJR2_TIGCA|nr:major facilitator superfamily domain-containing protein 1-like [Tigriopus californicus]TRY77914.1 hypothetical protein TCAL_07172 [Tigriopus californicus]